MQRENKCWDCGGKLDGENCVAGGVHDLYGENKWQDRFQERWKIAFQNHSNKKNGSALYTNILNFIQSEIDLAVKEERERIIKLLS